MPHNWLPWATAGWVQATCRALQPEPHFLSPVKGILKAWSQDPCRGATWQMHLWGLCRLASFHCVQDWFWVLSYSCVSTRIPWGTEHYFHGYSSLFSQRGDSAINLTLISQPSPMLHSWDCFLAKSSRPMLLIVLQKLVGDVQISVLLVGQLHSCHSLFWLWLLRQRWLSLVHCSEWSCNWGSIHNARPTVQLNFQLSCYS